MPDFARTLYKARARIEQGVGRLKRFKRVALRCEKTARNLTSIVSFAAGLCLIKFAHIAQSLQQVAADQSRHDQLRSAFLGEALLGGRLHRP